MAKRNANSPAEAIPADAKIARLLALAAIKEIQGVPEKVVFLKSAGFNIQEIAGILNIPNNNVSVALVRSKKKRKKA